MNNQDTRIADLPLSVIDLMLDIEELNDQLKMVRHTELFADNEERTVMTEADALLRLDEGQPSKNNKGNTDIMVKRHEWEAHAYCEVLEFMFENYRDIEISEACIMSLHNELYRYAPDDVWHKGIYKNDVNKVETKDLSGKTLRVLVEGTPWEETPQALRDLIRWYNEAPTAIKYPPLLRISAFVVEFLKIHPFVDGNGRVSRALTDLLLMKAGYLAEFYYPHEKIIENDTESYYLALSRSQKTFGSNKESIRTWTNFFLTMVHKQTRLAVAITSPVKAARLPVEQR